MSSHRTEEEASRLSMQKTERVYNACGRGEKGDKKVAAHQRRIRESSRLELGRVNKIMPRRWGYGTKRFWDYALRTRTEGVLRSLRPYFGPITKANTA
jgi:hypothetical protein